MITQGMHKKKENNTFFCVLDDQKIIVGFEVCGWKAEKPCLINKKEMKDNADQFCLYF